jgi:hypothetical protein
VEIFRPSTDPLGASFVLYLVDVLLISECGALVSTPVEHGQITLVPTYFASDDIRLYPPTGLAELIDQTGASS